MVEKLTLSFATYNMHGFRQGHDVLVHLCTDYDIVFIQEHCHALDAARLATTHIESKYKVATLSDMRPTHTALRLRDMDTASRRQS